LKLNKQMENWVYWSLCSLGGIWATEISPKFSILGLIYSQYASYPRYTERNFSPCSLMWT